MYILNILQFNQIYLNKAKKGKFPFSYHMKCKYLYVVICHLSLLKMAFVLQAFFIFT